jgi:hypothetical protein
VAGLEGFDTLKARSLQKSMKSRGDDDDKAPQATPGAAAAYIASLTEELAQIAKRNGLVPLGYILDMARLEADQVARGASAVDATGLDG